MPAAPPLSAALHAIAADEPRIVADMHRMLACDTSFPPGRGYDAFADLLQPDLQSLGFACTRVHVPEPLWTAPGAEGPRTNLIARRRTQTNPVCSMYVHTDTVPPGDGWTHPPFACTRQGRRLYGRGAADMKGTVAAILAALRAAAAHHTPLAYDPAILLCTDEEGGLYPGIRHLAEQRLIEGHLLSFNGGAAPRIWAGCFGSMDLLLTVTGQSAHSGDSAARGVNAIEAALPALNALAALKPRIEARTSALPPPPGATAPLHARLTITAAHGGDKGSALPGRFEILVNRRYMPEEDATAVRAEIESAIDAALHAGPALAHTTTLLGHLAPVTDPTGPHWPRWQRALTEGFGFPPESFVAYGASSSSDMGWVQQAGISEILLGGLGRPDRRIHAADEFTTIDDIIALARSVLAYLAADFAPDLIPEHAP